MVTSTFDRNGLFHPKREFGKEDQVLRRLTDAPFLFLIHYDAERAPDFWRGIIIKLWRLHLAPSVRTKKTFSLPLLTKNADTFGTRQRRQRRRHMKSFVSEKLFRLASFPTLLPVTHLARVEKLISCQKRPRASCIVAPSTRRGRKRRESSGEFFAKVAILTNSEQYFITELCVLVYLFCIYLHI
jgi:hypothetical protein